MNANDRAVTGFAMLGHAMFHAYELAIPLFVAIWLDVFSVSPATLGAVVGASYAAIGLGAIPSGVLADRLGSKRLVLACLLGMGGAFGLIGVAPNLLVLAAGLLFWGLSASLYHPAGLALLSRGATARGTAFAYHGVAGNVGVAVGPLLAAVLLVFFHWRTVALLLVVPVLVAALLALRLEFDETAGSEARGRSVADAARGGPGIRSFGEFRRRSVRLFTAGFAAVFVIGILYGLYYRGALTFLPEILAGLPVFDPVAVGGRSIEPARYVYSGLLLLGGLGQYAGGKLVDRVRVEYALAGTYLGLVAVALAFVPFADAGLGPLLVASGVLGFLLFMVAPINQEAISSYSAADVRGLSFGYNYAAVFGVGALGAWLAGAVLTRSTAAVLFLALAVLAMGAVALVVVLVVRPPRARRGEDLASPGK